MNKKKMTKYLLSAGEISEIDVEFEDQFKIVYFRKDISGRWTLYKENDIDNLFSIFETKQEAIDHQIKKIEKQVIDLQLKLKQTCENHALFLKKYNN